MNDGNTEVMTRIAMMRRQEAGQSPDRSGDCTLQALGGAAKDKFTSRTLLHKKSMSRRLLHTKPGDSFT